jgi:hypothetical protein
MKLLLENWRQYLNEEAVDVSDTLFFVESPWGVKNNKWDHVGFLLPNGKMKDMSGHRGEMVEPVISTWEEMRKDGFEHLPEDPQEAKEAGLFKTISLDKGVQVPDGIICRTDDPNKKSENCGSFVFNVLSNSGIDPSFLKSSEFMVVGKGFE